ncbi:MAG: hypothetical protein R3D25_06520 [Geminicoccaceae bacterium]
MATGPLDPGGLDRRRFVAALALVGGMAPASLLSAGPAAARRLSGDARSLLAAQILNGALPEPIAVVDACYDSLAAELGGDILDALIEAILERDAASIDEPFERPEIEAAARRLLEIFYTGEVVAADGSRDVPFFHQALAWHVLGFTKPPGICGPGFGWWADKPPTAS